MKIAITDLKKALQWIEDNTSETHVRMQEYMIEGGIIELVCQDKYGVQVRIKLYSDSNMMPKITREDIL